jgi:hypothetical protein
MKSNVTLWLLSSLMLTGLPLIGLTFGSADILNYLEFPPLTRYVAHAPFSLIAFIVIAVVDLLMLAGIISLLTVGFGRFTKDTSSPECKGNFPIWGGLGAVVMMAGWVLAWTRFPWFEPLQGHTFCLPWTGYILLVNALCFLRSGHSLLTDTPLRFFLLWPISAIFWWFFEYLNRFVQNWYYIGVDDFSPFEYVFHASLAFATVLPAVLSTHRLLLTFHIFQPGLKHLTPLKFFDDKRASGFILILSGIALALIGCFPDVLYPLVWGAPLLVFTSLQTLLGKKTIFSAIGRGDWRAVVASATAALICGFFWELWNYHSMARWEYAIPFVDRFHIFAMPLLGYGGYLPFGLECLLVGQFVMGKHLWNGTITAYPK